MKFSIAFATCMLLVSSAAAAQAGVFGSGGNMFDIDFVTIGNPGNAADPEDGSQKAGIQNFGAVANTFRMGKFEISEQMIDKANAEGGLGITKDTRGPDQPATDISWFEAARFVNWLNTDSNSTPAYKFVGGIFQLWDPGDTGYDPNNRYRNTQAQYFLPSADEWYKAAYFDPNKAGGAGYYNYPMGSDTAPTAVASGTAANTAVFDLTLAAGPADIMLAGGLSPYGTMGQGGNVWEMEETDVDLINGPAGGAGFPRGLRGGRWSEDINELSSSIRRSVSSEEFDKIGFRVASIIPEPSTLLLGALASLGMLMRRRHSS